MWHLLVVAVVAVGFVAWVTWAAARANEVFRIDVRDGRIARVRGKVQAQAVREMADVVRHARVDRAVIRGVRAAGRTRLVVRGTDPPTTQRLRNVFHTP